MNNSGRPGITLKPIGFVRTKGKEHDFRSRRTDIISQVVLYRRYANGLTGIEEYSHIFILYWLHKVGRAKRQHVLIYPKNRTDLPQIGVFSTRQSNRPNPIGLTVVELLQHRSNVLKVRGLDAFDGTPILDIKPYNRRDIPERIRAPD